MDLIAEFGTALWELTGAMAPYILVGLLFAGILHELVPGGFVQKHLGRDNVGSVIKATLFGIPLPVCSCGVVPLAAALKKEGASRGAVLGFLISTPITGIDSILATFGMFGWLFTLYRIVSSIVIAFLAGILANFSEKREIGNGKRKGIPNTPVFSISATSHPTSPTIDFPSSSCDCEGNCENESKKHFDWKAALKYGFVTLMGDIAKPLFWGLLIGAAITVAIPENVGEWLAQYTWLGYLLVIAIAVPMYVCATASLPIAASLVLSGVSLGAAFVFLSAGPATNTVTMGVVKRMLGTRSLLIYLVTIVAGSILFGLTIDLLFGTMAIDPKSVVHVEESTGIVAVLSSLILWGMVLRYLAVLFFRPKPNRSDESCRGG
ncbi:SO_0444 family Cu/Zn efflux transporter [Hydrogenimonas sp.]